MDNQQVRIAEDVGWLAGIFDGEGSFYINRRNHKNKTHYNCFKFKEWITYIPSARIGNFNQMIVEEIHRILKENQIGHNVNDHSDKGGRVVSIDGMKRCFKFCEFIKDHLKGKKYQAILLYNFLDYVFKNPDYGFGRPQDGNRGQSEKRRKEWESIKETLSSVNKLNLAINLRDFMPTNINNVDDKVQLQ